MRRTPGALLLAVSLLTNCASDAPNAVLDQSQRYREPTELPVPDTTGSVPLEAVLSQRRSQREFGEDPLPVAIIGQLFWAGQGITDGAGHRTAPSAGARYPLELYAVTPSAFLHYLPDGHRVEQRPDDAMLSALGTAAFGQSFVSAAPAVLLIAGVRARTEGEYGALADALMNREAGHAAQNILLQATALGLAVVPVGGFDPVEVSRRVGLPPGQEVLYLIPVGRPLSTG